MWTVPHKLATLEKQLKGLVLNTLLNMKNIDSTMFRLENTLDVILLYGGEDRKNLLFFLDVLYKDKTDLVLFGAIDKTISSFETIKQVTPELCIGLFLNFKTIENAFAILSERGIDSLSFSYLIDGSKLYEKTNEEFLFIRKYLACLVGNVFLLFSNKKKISIALSETLASLCLFSCLSFRSEVKKDFTSRNIFKQFRDDLLSLYFLNEIKAAQ